MTPYRLEMQAKAKINGTRDLYEFWGEMVRFMAENQIHDPEEMKKFNRLGYAYRAELSGDKKYVFVRDLL